MQVREHSEEKRKSTALLKSPEISLGETASWKEGPYKDRLWLCEKKPRIKKMGISISETKEQNDRIILTNNSSPVHRLRSPGGATGHRAGLSTEMVRVYNDRG